MIKKEAKDARDAAKNKLPKAQTIIEINSQDCSRLDVKYPINPTEKPIKHELAKSKGSEKNDASLIPAVCVSNVQVNP